MEDESVCDCCGEVFESVDLIWIDVDDFLPEEEDNWNSQKHQNAVEILSYSALCINCYKQECCDEEETQTQIE